METFIIQKVSFCIFAAEKQKIPVKEKILHIAAEKFLSQGFKSVTMDEIASGLGISKKTVYTHFSTKTELVEATTNLVFERISTGIDVIHGLDKDPIEELYEIKKFVMDNLKGEKASPVFQLQKYYPKIFKSLKIRQFDKMQETIIENLEKGIKMGVYRKNLNLAFVSRIYFLGVNGIKDENLFPRNEFSPKKIHEEFLNYHLRGIVTPTGLEKLIKVIKNNNH